jgi:hypothetical protein
MLVAARVDLALWGHHHSYQRTCQVQGNVCTPGAPVHVVIGTAGYELTHSLYPVRPAIFTTALDLYWFASSFMAQFNKPFALFETNSLGALRASTPVRPL